MPHSNELPTDAAELVRVLSTIFPGFAVCSDDDEGPETFHSVFLFHFNPYFSRHVSEFTPKQLAKLGALLDSAYEAGGNLGNAVDTCFLEHTRQLKVNQQLRPYIKASGKQRNAA